MTINVFSLIMAIAFFSIVSILCSIFTIRAKSYSPWIMAFILGLTFLRCILPIEIAGAFTVNCWTIYPELFRFTQKQIYRNITISDLLWAVWILGSVIQLIRLIIEIIQQFLLLHIIRSFPRDARIDAIGEQAANAVKCKRSPKIYITADIQSPSMIGFFRPIVLISKEVSELDDQTIEYILRHEISHYKGGDIWIRLLFRLLACALWWNPAVYLLHHSIIQLLELKSDHRACYSLTKANTLEYSSVLIQILKSNNKSKSTKTFFASCFVGNYYSNYIRQRINMLLFPDVKKFSPWKTVLIICVCTILFLGSYSFIFQPAAHPEISDNQFVINDQTDSWLVHINDDMYEWWINGKYETTLTLEQISSPPFNQMPIYEKE